MADIKNKLTPQEATEQIRYVLENGYFFVAGHCRKQMRSRNYTDPDIESLLLHGKIEEDPVFHKKRREWRYRVEGSIEGDETVLVIAFPSNVKLTCITIFALD